MFAKLKQKNNCFFFYINHFCGFFKSEGVSLKQTAEDFKNNFIIENKVVKKDDLKKWKHFFEANKMNNQLNIVVALEFETFDKTENAVSYAGALYLVSELSMKWNHDLTNEEIKNCLSHYKVFHGKHS